MKGNDDIFVRASYTQAQIEKIIINHPEEAFAAISNLKILSPWYYNDYCQRLYRQNLTRTQIIQIEKEDNKFIIYCNFNLCGRREHTLEYDTYQEAIIDANKLLTDNNYVFPTKFMVPSNMFECPQCKETGIVLKPAYSIICECPIGQILVENAKAGKKP